MRFGSVCSGIEAASVAWHPLGWETAFVAEIEPFPCAVLAHHYPTAPNYGDLTRFREWPDATLDVLVGGTPCQSFSVAGLRQGLADPRGNLALVFLGLVDRYRPRWVVWENVPGVLSSSGGRDFGAFLGGLAELGYGWAYRVLDAQYFGVAQRRRRVFVVGCLGDWRRAAAVLFEPESLRGDSPPRREAGERAAPTIASRPTGGGGLGTDFDCDEGLIQDFIPDTSNAICARDYKGARPEADQGAPLIAHSLRSQAQDPHDHTLGTYITHSLRADGFDASEDGTGRGTPLVPVAFSSKDHGADAGEVAPTLRSMGHDGSHANGGGQVAIAFDTTQITSAANYSNPKDGDPCHPLASGAHPPAIAFTQNQREEVRLLGSASATLKAPGTHEQTFMAQATGVRRLTPRECERLQGFPDDYTLVPSGGHGRRVDPTRLAPDGPRYKALGNSMAVPVMRWIGEQIAAVDALPPSPAGRRKVGG